MVYFLAVFIFHSIATMPTVYRTEDACEEAGKQTGVLYSCLGVATARIAEPVPDDEVDWEARRRFMHRTFRNAREKLSNPGKPAD